MYTALPVIVIMIALPIAFVATWLARGWFPTKEFNDTVNRRVFWWGTFLLVIFGFHYQSLFVSSALAKYCPTTKPGGAALQGNLGTVRLKLGVGCDWECLRMLASPLIDVVETNNRYDWEGPRILVAGPGLNRFERVRDVDGVCEAWNEHAKTFSRERAAAVVRFVPKGYCIKATAIRSSSADFEYAFDTSEERYRGLTILTMTTALKPTLKGEAIVLAEKKSVITHYPFVTPSVYGSTRCPDAYDAEEAVTRALRLP